MSDCNKHLCENKFYSSSKLNKGILAMKQKIISEGNKNFEQDERYKRLTQCKTNVDKIYDENECEKFYPNKEQLDKKRMEAEKKRMEVEKKRMEVEKQQKDIIDEINEKRHKKWEEERENIKKLEEREQKKIIAVIYEYDKPVYIFKGQIYSNNLIQKGDYIYYLYVKKEPETPMIPIFFTSKPDANKYIKENKDELTRRFGKKFRDYNIYPNDKYFVVSLEEGEGLNRELKREATKKINFSPKKKESPTKKKESPTKSKTRCPNGTRRNKKTGHCEANGTKKNSPIKRSSPIKTKTRCPNGTRRNKKTGNCEAK